MSKREKPQEVLKHLTNRLFESIDEKKKRRREQLRHKSFLEGGDGQFLGKLDTNRFDTDSIANRFGPYGSRFSDKSILNRFGNYGSRFSNLSPFNRFATNPPKIIMNGMFKGYLTTNRFKEDAIDPFEFLRRFNVEIQQKE